jgi:hypothetical protein
LRTARALADGFARHRRALVVLAGLLAAALLYLSGAAHALVSSFAGLGYFGALLAGFFFSSGLTTPTALLVLAELSLQHPPGLVALLAAFGATVADFWLFRLFKAASPDTLRLTRAVTRRLRRSRNSLLYRATPLLAGLVMASPLPDELALALYGVEDYEERGFLVFTFLFKLLGVLAVSLAAGARL